MLVKMRSLSCSIFRPSDRLLAEDADVFGDAALGERLGLLDPVVALDAAVEGEIAVDPVALGLLPGSDLREGEDAQRMQDALDLRADAGDQLEIVDRGRPVDTGRTVLILQRRFCRLCRRRLGFRRLEGI